jgi:hypothetical protein
MLAGDGQTIAEIGPNDKLICAPLDKARPTVDIAGRRASGGSPTRGAGDPRRSIALSSGLGSKPTARPKAARVDPALFGDAAFHADRVATIFGY